MREHPLSQLIPRAKSNLSETKRRAVERYERGDVDFEGLISEEWQKDDIQEELARIVGRYENIPVRLNKEIGGCRKRFMTGLGDGFQVLNLESR